MSYYVIKKKHSIPGFLFWAVASWEIVLAGVTLVLVILWIVDATAHFDVLKGLPSPLTTFLGFCGAYAAFGGFCLYMTMWVYWIAVERSPIAVRIGWLLALLFGLHVGAMIYAFVVWKRDITKVTGPQPLRSTIA